MFLLHPALIPVNDFTYDAISNAAVQEYGIILCMEQTRSEHCSKVKKEDHGILTNLTVL
jgi:hypothetical protein